MHNFLFLIRAILHIPHKYYIAVGRFDRVAPAGQRVYPTSDTEEDDAEMVSSSVIQSAANTNRFQYRTPNLSDRLKSEQLHEEMAKVNLHRIS